MDIRKGEQFLVPFEVTVERTHHLAGRDYAHPDDFVRCLLWQRKTLS